MSVEILHEKYQGGKTLKMDEFLYELNAPQKFKFDTLNISMEKHRAFTDLTSN